MKLKPPTARSDETITCPSCQALNNRRAEFCHKCGAPLGPVATLDPMQTIQAEGFLLRKATEGRPSRIVLIGIWIVFLPCLVGTVYSAIRLLFGERGSFGFFFFWGSIGLSIIAFMILYRVTKNYLTIPKKQLDD